MKLIKQCIEEPVPGSSSWLLFMFISSCECAITTVLFSTGWHSLRQEDLLFTKQHSAISEKEGKKVVYCCWVAQSVVKPFRKKRKLRAHVLLKMHFSWQESHVCALLAKHPCVCSFPFNPQHIGSRQARASCFYNATGLSRQSVEVIFQPDIFCSWGSL